MTKNQLVDIWKRVCVSTLHSSGDGARHLIKFLQESAVTNSSLWSNLMNIDDDTETLGSGNQAAAAAGRNLNHLGNANGVDLRAEPEVGMLNGSILNGNSLAWDVALLARHPDAKVAEAAFNLLHGKCILKIE